MKATEIAALPIRAGAAVRHARFFHPVGVLCAGTLTRTAAPGAGLPIADSEVVGRISKGAGTPGGLPDFAGLAWRARAAEHSEPWDILLVSATARVILTPSRSWLSAVFSTVMPFGYRGKVYWLRARLQSPADLPGLAVDDVRRRLHEGPITVAVEQARGPGDFAPVATIEFDRTLSDTWPPGDVAFDPTLNIAAGVSLLPEWLTAVRRRAYRSSRQGRSSE